MKRRVRSMAGAALVLGQALWLIGVASPAAASDVETFEHVGHNYRFRPPHAGWNRWNASRINPAASLAYVRQKPLSFFMVAFEDLGISNPLGLEELADLVEATGGSTSRRYERARHRLNGLEGMRLVFDHEQSGQTFHFVSWVTLNNGFVHQLSTWAPASASTVDQVILMADELFQGFSLIDEKRISTADGQRIEAHHSKRYGYEVDLSGGLWRSWESMATDLPGADFGVLRGEDAVLAVLPIRLRGSDPTLEAVAAGLGARINGFDLGAGRKIEVDGRAGLEFDFEETLGIQRYRYRARVLRGDDVGVLVVAWTRASHEDAESILAKIELVRLRGKKLPALDLPALEGAARERHSLAFNEIGLYYYERAKRSEAADWFGASVEIDPSQTMVLQNLAQVEIEMGRHTEALAALAARTELVEATPSLLAYRGLAYEMLGKTDEALRDYAAALEAGLEDTEVETRYVDLLLAAGVGDRAMAYLDERIAAGSSAPLRRLRARVARETGDVEGSIEALEALRVERPRDLEVLYELALGYKTAGQHSKAIETYDAILAVDGPSSGALYLKASSQFDVGRYKESKASLEAALLLEPESEAAQEALRLVSGMLGEGENSMVKQAIDPVELPKRMRKYMNGAKEPPDAGEYDTYALHHVLGIHYEAGKELRSTTWWSARALDKRGVERLSSIEVPFNPLFEALHVNSVVVRDGDGAVVSQGRAEDSYVLDKPEGMATGEKILHVPVRGVEPGATVELIVSRRERAPPERFTYVDHRFSHTTPVSRTALFVAGDIDGLEHEASEGVSRKKHDGWIEWRVENPPPLRWEPLLPRQIDWLPGVRIANGQDSWEKLAREYIGEIESHLRPSDKARELAAEYSKDSQSADEKARALASFVQGALTYKAIEFGRRARIPNASEETIENRYGDCKDHAVLLHQLLSAAGVRSRLALASVTSEVSPALASLDQFDHMIVHCLDCEGGRFFDATDKNLALGRVVPRGLGGQRVLVLDREAPRLTVLPKPKEGRHLGASDRSVELSEDGSVLVAETLELRGYPAAMLRDFLRKVDSSDWKEAVRQVMRARGTTASVRDFTVKGLDETPDELVVSLRYEVEATFSSVSSGFVGKLPMVWETEFLGVDRVEKRASPFDVVVPIHFSGRVRLTAPKGYGVKRSTGDPPIQRRGSFTRWSGSVSKAGGDLVLSYEIARTGGRQPASLYSVLQEETDGAFQFLRQPLELAPLD